MAMAISMLNMKSAIPQYPSLPYEYIYAEQAMLAMNIGEEAKLVCKFIENGVIGKVVQKYRGNKVCRSG